MRPTFIRSIRILLATDALAVTAFALPAAEPAGAGAFVARERPVAQPQAAAEAVR
jgi:hypothetical protein